MARVRVRPFVARSRCGIPSNPEKASPYTAHSRSSAWRRLRTGSSHHQKVGKTPLRSVLGASRIHKSYFRSHKIILLEDATLSPIHYPPESKTECSVLVTLLGNTRPAQRDANHIIYLMHQQTNTLSEYNQQTSLSLRLLATNDCLC